jgi:hypothetical protein
MEKTASGPSNETGTLASYHFIEHWSVDGAAQEVFGIMTDFSGYPSWWPVYERITPVAGQELTFDGVIRGLLPYRVRLRYRILDLLPSKSWRVESTGDLTGEARWSITEDHGRTMIRLDWDLLATRPLLKYASLIVRPLLAFNHRWAMRIGERGLRARLASSKSKQQS